MKRAAILVAAALAAGCSSHAQVQYGASSFTGSGTSISSTTGSVNVQSSGSGAAVLLGLGLAAGLMSRAQGEGVEYRPSSFSAVAPPEPARAPELVPGRRVNEQDCTRPIEDWSANLKCR